MYRGVFANNNYRKTNRTRCDWWGRWDLNPGSRTPQARILNHARRRPHDLRLRFGGLRPIGVACQYLSFLNKLTVSLSVIMGLAMLIDVRSILKQPAWGNATKRKKAWRVNCCYLCSFRTVIGEVLVSAMPGMARKISPTK